ncbi:MAG TPA: sigma-70 family RNA polymerase sigma factor, partial [Thermoanaerobaculia bacterium]|nr:sigma-70 family RNA polymerase sigma factor [Thermoanaerobaculia bacterium]
MELVYSENRRRQETAQAADRELVAEARGGDLLAFEALVARKTPAVLAVARRVVGNPEDARDVAQMVFLRVWEQLDRYDATWSFNTWLYRIATNLAIDFLRSSRSRERAHGATLHLVRQRVESTSLETTRA